MLDFPIRSILGSRLLAGILENLNRVKLNRVRSFRRFLVNPDIHIGDAIMSQATVSALQDFFPDAEVDFITNRSVMPLLEGNPEVHRFFPLYSGGAFCPDSEVKAVAEVMRQGEYDLCINANPFLAGNKIEQAQPVFDLTTHAPTLIANERTTTEINHFAFQYQEFVRDLLSRFAEPRRERPFGISVRLSDAAIEEAARFLEGFESHRPLVLMNTDTASRYTRLPFHYQAEMIARLLQKDISLLIGAGHTEKGIGERLLESIPSDARARVRLVPASMSLEGYSALGDRCDLFVTGDTGPMHIAAARKYSRSGKYTLRNRTAVLCFFGATLPRMSGYDSFQPGYLPANQDAPSWTVVAGSPCRNVTCLNKMFKTCQTIRCFETLDLQKVDELVAGHIDGLRRF